MSLGLALDARCSARAAFPPVAAAAFLASVATAVALALASALLHIFLRFIVLPL